MTEFKFVKNIPTDDLLILYQNAKWTAYTKDILKLKRAVSNSLEVISAWENDKLVGLIRSVGDKETICYIQDILVLNDYKRKGIGKQLLHKLLYNCKDIRQIVLLTDAQDIDVRKFYESQGFASCDDNEVVAFRKL